jgi:drug/metabolite transporter (DMT)-like permease
MSKSPSIWGWVLLFVSFVWGMEFALVHQALESLAPNTFNALRFLVAIITLAVYFLVSRYRWRQQLNRATVHHGVLLGVLLFIGFSTQSIGLQYTTASNGGFITGLNVVLVPVIAWLWLKQPQHWYACLVIPEFTCPGSMLFSTLASIYFNFGLAAAGHSPVKSSNASSAKELAQQFPGSLSQNRQ